MKLNRRTFLGGIVALGGCVQGIPTPAKEKPKIAKVDITVPGQKYQRGDRVHITKDMPHCMDHFHKDKDATVMYSFEERYGDPEDRKGEPEYCVDIDGHGKVSWYYEHQLLPIMEA